MDVLTIPKMPTAQEILGGETFTKNTLVKLLNAEGKDREHIFEYASKIKRNHIGKKVHLRGLIELTNRCSKNCYYCGIAAGLKNVDRFNLDMDAVENAIRFIVKNNYGSIVIQSGELQSEAFTNQVEEILNLIQNIGKGRLGITLSCGEQSVETYRKWKEAGAQRYLLRIETSNEDLYYKLHPRDHNHDYQNRLKALKSLKDLGYQTGTGVMIGLPFQTVETLAEDLLFMRDIDIDMCGMGPYIEHSSTPLFENNSEVPSKERRLDLSLKMIAILRIMMKDINIAATTAMQTLKDGGREMALNAGANILMPNTTPGLYREQYSLYNNKPGINEEAEDSKISIEKLIKRAGCTPAYGEKGNSWHYFFRRTFA